MFVELTILHTNDMHGTLTEERFRWLEQLRQSSDLYFDSGDAIKTGNLGIPLRPEAVWPLLDRLKCTASVLGNRETHVLESAFLGKLAGAKHPILCGNLRKKDGSRPLPRTLELTVKGVRIGIFSVMVPMVTERMATKAASAYLWDQPIPTAIELASELRPKVDLLICLSHIGHRQDRELAEKCPAIDIIFGGHSHTVLEQPELVGTTAICQGGSHNRFAGVYRWTPETGITGGLVAAA
jgi:2',3'-cyclic-nucleotide 2'-phosphodiesterase (5'-nucleotidase family)